MISSISIHNFRCYKHLKIDKFSRLNIIVGDNGSGKTALLESILFPLGTGPELGLRMRNQRGLDNTLGGTPKDIEDALWGDFFYNQDMTLPISLILDGDGKDSRSLEIYRGGAGSYTLELEDQSETHHSPITFLWKDSEKRSYPVVPIVGAKGLDFPGTGENINGFYFFSANQTVGATESAGRFSKLSITNKHRKFIDIFKKEYEWIEDINVEVVAGMPVLFATLRDSGRKLPLPNISSGLNRIIGIMLAIASAPKGIVLVDEIENGIHYSHLTAIWRAILNLLREYETQLFISTHSQECLSALIDAAGENVSDIVLWQTERRDGEHNVSTFRGEELKNALDYNEEVR